MTVTVFVVFLLSATAGVLAQGGDKRITDPCSGYCLNGGTCSDSGNSPTCTCPRGFSGTNCEIHPGTCPIVQPGDASNCGGVPCETDIRCEFGQKCCDLGCGGKRCTPVVTRDPCIPDPFVCKNGGTCTSPLDLIKCQCKSGFGGDRCENKVPVKIGTCEDFASRREFNCTPGCNNDYDCPDTEKCCITRCVPQCTNRIIINQCAGYCLNGGTCTDPGTGPTCSCPRGFSGTNCEIHPGTCPIVQPGDSSVCGGVPCATDVQCEFGQKCCELGCGGKWCTPVVTRDPCIPDPFVCKNGGTCTSPFDGIICQCKSGFGGDRCENTVPVKLGTCEDAIEGEFNCTRGCDNDYDCLGTQKCCNTACERQCSSIYPTPVPTEPFLTCLTAKCTSTTVCRHIVECLRSPFKPKCIPSSSVPKDIDSKCKAGGYSEAVLIQSPTKSTSYSPLLCGGPADVSTNTCPYDSVCVGRVYGRGHCCRGVFESQPSQ